MISSVLIIVPHQDDDLNIAGCLLDQMIKARIHISVCFVTNGDYDGKELTRSHEVKKVAKIFDYEKVYYLGYGDGGINKESLYYASDYNTIVCSHSGYSETHGVGEYSDFHYELYGNHAPYTKNNLRSDIKDICLKIKPDLIFCVAGDSHPDHKLVSELFDEALELIIRETDFRPLVLKKFAYLGIWHGPDDYFSIEAKETECIDSKNNEIVTTCSPYIWEQRLRFSVSHDMYNLFFLKSKLFKAYRMYKSQSGAAFFSRCCNIDATYWFCNTMTKSIGLLEDFPIEETPFSLFENRIGQKRSALKCYVFKYYYDIYVFLFYNIPGKIKQIIERGFKFK